MKLKDCKSGKSSRERTKGATRTFIGRLFKSISVESLLRVSWFISILDGAIKASDGELCARLDL